MKIYLLYIRILSGRLEGIYSSRENAENEVESGEEYAILEKDIDSAIYIEDLRKLKFVEKQ